MSDNGKHLLVCAIGPVQDFIATARTSHDLWFGSWMLSELSKAGARATSGPPHQLIFPATQSAQDLEPGAPQSVANKIVAIIQGDPGITAGQVSQAVRDRLRQLYDSTVATIENGIDHDLAREQILDLVEFAWSSVPYDDERDFPETRARAEALLAARKNTRNFGQRLGREGRPKSSLDGFRESVLLPAYKDGDSTALDQAEPGEELSGVDLLKRYRGKAGDPVFISTTDLAAMPFLLGLGPERKQVLLQRIKDLLNDYAHRPETEGAHFYGERLAQLIRDETQRKEFRERFARILSEGEAPSPYYGLLRADGDNLGKVIDAQRTPAAHRALSLSLSNFSLQARQIIATYNGTPIYLGGDDLLAYVPLHTALQCVADLDHEFAAHLADLHYEDNRERIGPSLSFGLVIAHHVTPLSDTLEVARQAEREAKEIDGKNGLAIVLSKRSGTDRIVKGKVQPMLERMEILVKAVGEVSKGTPYELETLDRQLRLAGLGSDTEAAHREAGRIIGRKRESGGTSPAVSEVQEQLVRWLSQKATTLPQLAQEMIIAAEFARARRTAGASLSLLKEVRP